MEATLFSPNQMPKLKQSQPKIGKSKESTSKSSELFSLNNLSIKIEKLKSGKQKGYYAKIKELNSTVMADSIEEIFKLIPILIEVEASKLQRKI